MTQPAAARTACILVVDDNPLQLTSQRLHLERAGFRVTTAASADEALAALRHESPDLVLSDVMMPGTDGFQLCRALRREPASRALPVVLISGHYGEALDVRHAAHCGANMFVARSDGADALVRGIRQALEHPGIRLDPCDDATLDSEHNRRVTDQLDRLSRAHADAGAYCRTILDGMADGVLVTDGDFVVRDANPAMERITGYTQSESRGWPLAAFVALEEHERLAGEVRRYAETGRYEGDVAFLHKDGSVRRARITGRRVRPDLYVNILRDVTESVRNEELVQRLADTDTLTGLANRTALQQLLERAVTEAVGGGPPVGVLLTSLGNFREINDTLGPDGGDRVLREIAARMMHAAAGTDIVCARLGAAQFALLLPRLDNDQHLVRAAHALLATLAVPITVDGIPVDVVPCIGSAHCPDDAITGNELLRRASVAMHHARESRIPYASYNTQNDPFDLRQLTLISELRHAIACDQLELWYQPKLDLHSGRVDSVEALVRWRHPERGLIPPDAFIPAAERTGLIHLLTGWVLRTALKQSRHWRDMGLRLNVSINVSQSDLREDSFQAQVLRALEDNGVPPSSLTLEITESAVMHDPKRAAETLGELRKHGLRISLDDFGTGQASLAHLHHLPVDEIKLDKSFVLDLPNGHSKSIAGVTALLAREFGLKSVAEGMETAACQLLLGELGFDRVQGYHLSKPLPAAQLENWILQRSVMDAAAPAPTTRRH